ncbi:hypothetical protein ACIA8K_30720 [Catenuloplanes sp. NPDC051500]|uniref:hypothetical protein n=1 Tax=Catenuloplanes sp. NPDC051500 TaxID=3363959 RepID=UPI0037B7556A
MDSVLVGGVRDGEKMNAGNAALIEIEEDGLVHRYIRTSKSQDSLIVFNSDGVVNPEGAEDGIESSADRVATATDSDRS